MDSGNSGSMQSSSGGDDEFDSRAESISAFLNNPPAHHHHVAPFNQPSHTQVFDPLSNYFEPNIPIQRPPPPPNPLLNLDMVWSKPGRSEPNPADLGVFMPSSSSGQNQAFFSGQTQSRGGAFHALPPESSSPGLLSVSAANDQSHPTNINSASTNSNVVRNPKKRSRASRRAPTTVLTTDTTNFRAMVQEFTGIPAPPFTSSPFPRARLDLFASAPHSSLRSAHLDPPLPPYLLRPFPQKLHPPNPFLSPSTTAPTSSSSSSMLSFPTTMVDALASNPTTNSSSSINYQLSSDLGLLKQSLNVNMHNPILSFHSVLQPPPKYPSPNTTSSPSINLAPKSQGSLEIPPGGSDSHLKVGVLEELGLNHNAHVNASVSGLHHNMVSSSSDGAMTRRDNNNNNMGTSTTNVDGGHGSLVRSLGGTDYRNAERVTSNNGIVNYLASSDFHGEKGPECVTAAPRSEGMVESWINCSSD